MDPNLYISAQHNLKLMWSTFDCCMIAKLKNKNFRNLYYVYCIFIFILKANQKKKDDLFLIYIIIILFVSPTNRHCLKKQTFLHHLSRSTNCLGHKSSIASQTFLVHTITSSIVQLTKNTLCLTWTNNNLPIPPNNNVLIKCAF